jgi:ComF family protein
VVYGWLQRLFVESCPACGGPSPGGFCAVCSAELARVPDACPRCGLGRPVRRCPRAKSQWYVEGVVAPFSYAPPLDHYLHALKYGGARSLGRAFGLLLLPALAELRQDVDALVAVPLHRTRLAERGYNQAQEIARTLGHELRLPALSRAITRRAATPAQTGQTARQRQVGVAGVFRVARDLFGRRIAIVDDVVTTGATINALAAALRAAGAARCIAVAVARTPQPRNV